MNLLINKNKNYVYNLILIIINKYLKIYRYLLYIKIINIIILAELFFKEIVFRYKTLAGIIFNRGLVFISKF